MLQEGKTFEEVIAALEIPSLTTRASRGASTYHAQSILWEYISGQYGPSMFAAIDQLEPGQFTEILKTTAGFQIVRVDRRQDSPGLDAPEILALIEERAKRVLMADALREFDQQYGSGTQATLQ